MTQINDVAVHLKTIFKQTFLFEFQMKFDHLFKGFVSDHWSRYAFVNAAASMVGLSNIMLRALTEFSVVSNIILFFLFVLLEASEL